MNRELVLINAESRPVGLIWSARFRCKVTSFGETVYTAAILSEFLARELKAPVTCFVEFAPNADV